MNEQRANGLLSNRINALVKNGADIYDQWLIARKDQDIQLCKAILGVEESTISPQLLSEFKKALAYYLPVSANDRRYFLLAMGLEPEKIIYISYEGTSINFASEFVHYLTTKKQLNLFVKGLLNFLSTE